MAFIIAGGSVVSYAEALDVRDKDQRVFEANEIDFTNVPDAPASLDEYIEDLAAKATDRINTKIRLSSAWREYLGRAGSGYTGLNTVPNFDPNKIVTHKAMFTDMCAFYVLKEFILPKVADFGDPESPDVQKITYYENKFSDYFKELMSDFTYYDNDGDGSVEDGEKQVTFGFLRRGRGRRNVVRVR
tara:strand:+ start:1088 stop:1648 length:561 start_codon:yes stop_codon:yes gene_type:complete